MGSTDDTDFQTSMNDHPQTYPNIGATMEVHRVPGHGFLELKALDSIGSNEEAQLLNYLKATGFHRGLLINFGSKRLEFKRMVYGSADKPNRQIQSV